MMSRGAELEDDEVEIVVDYLAKNFGPVKTSAATRKKHSQTAPLKGNPVTAARKTTALGLSAKDPSQSFRSESKIAISRNGTI